MEVSINKATSALKLRDGSGLHKTTDYENTASVKLASGQSDQARIPAFPSLRLPAELRIQIYRYLLHSRDRIYIDSSGPLKEVSSHRAQAFRHIRTRKPYGDMFEYTYWVTAIGLHPAILSASRQTYLEASGILYSENSFLCRVRIDELFFARANPAGLAPAVIPFLEDRSEVSRRLIKKIGFSYVFDESTLDVCRDLADQDYGFERTCDYLGQNLQLEHVTLDFHIACTLTVRSDAPYKNYVSNLDKQSWIQHLVPLVGKLETFKVIVWCDDYPDMARAVQRYLESKLPKTSKTLCQCYKLEPKPTSTAGQQSYRLVLLD